MSIFSRCSLPVFALVSNLALNLVSEPLAAAESADDGEPKAAESELPSRHSPATPAEQADHNRWLQGILTGKPGQGTKLRLFGDGPATFTFGNPDESTLELKDEGKGGFRLRLLDRERKESWSGPWNSLGDTAKAPKQVHQILDRWLEALEEMTRAPVVP